MSLTKGPDVISVTKTLNLKIEDVAQVIKSRHGAHLKLRQGRHQETLVVTRKILKVHVSRNVDILIHKMLFSQESREEANNNFYHLWII